MEISHGARLIVHYLNFYMYLLLLYSIFICVFYLDLVLFKKRKYENSSRIDKK